MQEIVNVVFESETAPRACECDACRNIGEVIKLRLPSTMYHDRNTLSTRYYNYWLCSKCKDGLLLALSGGQNGGQGGN